MPDRHASASGSPWPEERRFATFASYVPQIVLHHVASVAAGARAPAVERLSAAVLFIDISGFTVLTTRAVEEGPEGIERLSRSLDAGMGRIIDLVADHGGDVCKIVGDALISIWLAATPDGLPMAAERAAACGRAVAERLGALEVEGHRLPLKVGVSAGDLVVGHVGGEGDRWLFLLAGDAIAQLSEIEGVMAAGRVVASHAAEVVLSQRSGVATAPAPTRPVGSAPARLESIPTGRGVEMLDGVRKYVPAVCLPRLDAGQAAWLAELRRTSVAFVSVRAAEGLGSDATTVPRLHDATVAAQRILARYDGWLKEVTMDEKGTTLVAVFGVPPFSHEDDASRAVRASLAVQSALDELGLSATIGLATGNAFCGPVGNARRRDFVVLGRHVNVAARLAAAGDVGWALCDAVTQGAAGGAESLAFDRVASFVLKGLPEPIETYRVGLRGGAERVASMVDRTTEVERARTAIEALSSGTGGLVVLEGEPGIGKTRLADEWRRLARAANVRVITGIAEEIDDATPYHAWRSVFGELLGLEGVVEGDRRRELVLERLAGDAEALRLAPLLNQVVALDVPDDPFTAQLTGEVRADNTRDLLVRLLRSARQRAPLAIVLEDGHWLDSASWTLLGRVLNDLPEVLVIMTMRPLRGGDLDPIPAYRAAATTLRLEPLAVDDVVALACERTGAQRLDPTVAAIVQERAEGNPLFIEQLAFAMRDAGRIVVDGGLCRAASEGALDAAIIPDTVQRVITTRIDHLAPDEALTLKVASVIGQRFAVSTLREIHPLGPSVGNLTRQLDDLANLDLLTRLPTPGQPTYEFSHRITQEVAYNLMLGRQSRELHERLAEWYEATVAAASRPFHATLAHHWQRAGNPDRAVEHLESAGVHAAQSFASSEVIRFLEEAERVADESDLAIPDDRRWRWALLLGEAHVHMSRYREGRRHLERGLRLSGRPVPDSALRQGTALVGEILRQALRRLGVHRPRRELDAVETDELVSTLRAYERLSEASYYDRETLLPLYCVLRILNQGEASGIPAEIARGYAGTGALLGIVPMRRLADWYLDRAVKRLDGVEDLPTHEIVRIVAGFDHVGAARWGPARQELATVRDIAVRLGDRRRLDDANGNLMELEAMQGHFTTARTLATELVTDATARSDHRYLADGLCGLTYSAWQLGDAATAFETLATLDALFAEHADFTDDLAIQVNGLRALMKLDAGDDEGAARAASEAMRLTARQRPTFFATLFGYVGPAEVHVALAERTISTGRGTSADRATAEDAVARVRRFASVFAIARPRASTLDGRLRWASGDRAGAMNAWGRALALSRTLAMPYEEALAHRELGRRLDPGDPRAAEHLGHAARIFDELGAARASQELVDAELARPAVSEA